MDTDSRDKTAFSVDGNGVRPNPKKIEAVMSYPQPVNVEELHRFMGLTSYYRSDQGVVVLAQADNKGIEKVIAHASKAFSKSELNWTWLRKMKNPSGKLARWLLRLEEYSFEVINKPGKLMPHVDALSRKPVVNAIFVSGFWSKDEFAVAQSEDPDIALVKKWVETGQKPETLQKDVSSTVKTLFAIFDRLLIEDGLLCRGWVDAEGEEVRQVIVPEVLRMEVLQKVHETVGHMGIKKTFSAIQERFYWPRFFRDTETFVNGCEVCLKNKVIPRPRWPLKPIQVTPIPFYMIGMDIVGPLKITSRKNVYILTVIDYFTKFGEAVPLSDQRSETICRALEEIFARHGMPTILLRDQGTNMESHVVDALLHGRPPRLPMDLQANSVFWSPAQEHRNLANIRSRTDILRGKAMQNIKEAQTVQKQNYDRRYSAERAKPLRIGDFVLVKNNRARGLDLKYTGPFQIIQTIGEDFKICCQNTGKEKVVHYNRLKYFTPGILESGEETDLEPHEEDSESDEEVELTYKPPQHLQQPQVVNLQRGTDMRRTPDFYGEPVPSELI
eukprot:gene1575-1741_t